MVDEKRPEEEPTGIVPGLPPILPTIPVFPTIPEIPFLPKAGLLETIAKVFPLPPVPLKLPPYPVIPLPGSVPTIPGEVPDIYPGYKSELQTLTYQVAAKSLEADILTSYVEDLGKLVPTTTLVSDKQRIHELTQRVTRKVAESAADMQRNLWKTNVMQRFDLAGKSAQEVLALYSPPYVADQADITWLKAHLEKLPVLPEIPPGEPPITEEELRRRVAKELIAKREVVRPRPVSLASLSVEEIIRSMIVVPFAPKVSVSMDELKQMLIDAGIEIGDAEKLTSQEEHQKTLMESWRKTNIQIEALKTGMAQVARADIPWWAWFLEGLAEAPPMQAFRWYVKNWDYPRSANLFELVVQMKHNAKLRALMEPSPLISIPHQGAFFLLATIIPDAKEKEFEEHHKKALAAGANRWEAFGTAWEDTDINGFLKFAVEVGTDPVTWIGWGIYPAITRGIPILGHVVAGFERGYVRLWDVLIFDQLKAIGRMAPKSVAMRASEYQYMIIDELRKAIVDITKSEPSRISPRAMEQLFKAGIEAFKIHGGLQGGPWELGRAVVNVAGRVVSNDTILSWAKTLRSHTIKAIDDITPIMRTNLESVIDDTLRGSSQVKETADKLLALFDAPSTKATQRASTAIVETYLKSLGAAALKLIAPRAGERTGFNIVQRIGQASRDSYIAAARSAIYLERTKQGMVGQILNRVDPIARLIWSDTIEHHIIRKSAIANLAFGAYGIGNIFEGVIKPVFARLPVTPWMPRWLTRFIGGNTLSPTDLFPVVNKGLRSVPEITANIARPEAYYPVTATRFMDWDTVTDIWMGRFPPFPEWLPLVGGRRFDLQAWLVDAPGRVGTIQRTDYLNKIFVRFLGEEVDTPMVSTLQSLLDRHLRNMPTGIDRGTTDLIKHYLRYAVLTDPDEVHAMYRAIFNTRDARELEKVLAKLTKIDPAIKESLINSVTVGDIWEGFGKKIPEYMESMREIQVRAFLKSPEGLTNRYRDLASEINSRIPTTYEGVLEEISFIREMVDIYQASITSILKQAQYEGRVLKGAAKQKLHDEVWESLMTFIDTADDVLNPVITKVLRELETVGRGLPIDEALKTIKWGRNIPKEKRAYLLEGLRNLPASVKLSIRGIRINPQISEKEALAQFLPDKGIIEFADLGAITHARLYHEVGHSLIRDTIQRGDFSLFEKAITIVTKEPYGPAEMRKSLAKIKIRILKENPAILKTWPDSSLLYGHDLVYKELEEALARVFSTYFEFGGFVDLPPLRILFHNIERMFPKTAPKIPIGDKQIDMLSRYLNIQSQYLDAYVKARTLHAGYRADRFRQPKPKTPDELSTWWDETYNTIDTFYKEAHDKYLELLRTSGIGEAALIDELVAPPVVIATGKRITGNELAQLLMGSSDNIAEGVLRRDLNILRDKDEFIAYVMGVAGRMPRTAGKTLESMGWTDARVGDLYDTLLRQTHQVESLGPPLEPVMRELQEVESAIWNIWYTKGVNAAKAGELETWINKLVDDLKDIPGYSTLGKTDPAWVAKRQEAMDLASKEYFKDWADYSHPSVLNAFMRGAIYPFWTYEVHRWHWLPRAALQHPGVLPAWANYMDKTDRGYIQVPGTNLSVNFLRGTIAMGGATRLFMRDFPEYYDMFPEMAETVDFFGRFGFYPNIFAQGALALLGTADWRRGMAAWELLPTWMKSPLGAFIASTDSKPAKALRNVLFPDRYRDYYALLLAMQKVQKNPELELNPFQIWSNRLRGVPLSLEEESFWDSNIREVMYWGILMEQSGVMRLRPEELTQALKYVQEVIAEITGISPEEQVSLQRQGLRYNDFIRQYVAPSEQRLLNQLDAFQIWSRRITPLLPSLEAQKSLLMSEFYDEVGRLREGAKTTGIFEYDVITGKPDPKRMIFRGQERIDEEALETGNMSRWRTESAEKSRKIVAAIQSLHSTASYKNVPLTIEERKEEWRKTGKLPLALHPAEELRNLWYENKVERVEQIDAETGSQITYDDWDTFWSLRAAFLKNLGEMRPDFIQQLELESTALEKLFADVYMRQIFPYRQGVKALVLTLFTNEEKALLREFQVTSPERRAEIREVLRKDGRKVLAAFQDHIRTARRNYRLLNPEVDAWLRFFEYTESTLTPQAEALYKKFRAEARMKP